MKPIFPFVAVITATVMAVAGCAKQEPQTEAARPVMLAQVVPGSGAETAVFAGEVKPRYESDLAFRIPGKIVVRAVDAGARVTQGTGARAARSGRRRPAGGSRAGAGRSSAERVRVRAGRIPALPDTARAEVHQRVGARREAQHDEHEPREARAGEGQSRRDAESGGVRDARCAGGRRDHVGHGRSGTGRRGRAGGDAARARDRARGRDRGAGGAPAGALPRRADRRRAGRRAAEAVPREGARDRAGGRSGDADVRRARVGRRSGAGAAVGDDRQRRARRARRAVDEPPAVDVGLSDR